MMAQMYDFTCKGVFGLPEYGIKTGWQSNGTYTNGPFQLGARTKLGFWEYLKEDPERMKLFSSGMRSKTTIGSGRRSGAYPFGDELSSVPTEDDEVFIVDVGGGRGQSLEAIKNDYPDLKGRFILQDLPDVIEDAKTNGLPSFIEPHVGSFFEPQAIKGTILKPPLPGGAYAELFFSSRCPSLLLPQNPPRLGPEPISTDSNKHAGSHDCAISHYHCGYGPTKQACAKRYGAAGSEYDELWGNGEDRESVVGAYHVGWVEIEEDLEGRRRHKTLGH